MRKVVLCTVLVPVALLVVGNVLAQPAPKPPPLPSGPDMEITSVQTTKWMNGAPMRQSTKDLELEVTISNRGDRPGTYKIGRSNERQRATFDGNGYKDFNTWAPVVVPARSYVKVVLKDPQELAGRQRQREVFELFSGGGSGGDPNPYAPDSNARVVATKTVAVNPQCMNFSADGDKAKLEVVSLVGGTGDATAPATSGPRLKYSDVIVSTYPQIELEGLCWISLRVTNDSTVVANGSGPTPVKVGLLNSLPLLPGQRPFLADERIVVRPGETRTYGFRFPCDAGTRTIAFNDAFKGPVMAPTKAIRATYGPCAPTVETDLKEKDRK